MGELSSMADEIDDSVEVSAIVPGRCVDSDPRCAAILDSLPPILEEACLGGGKSQSCNLSIEEDRGSIERDVQSVEMSLAGGETQISDGDGGPMNGFGQASSALPEFPCQVTSVSSSVLPKKFSNVGLDDLGEGTVMSLQGPALHRAPDCETVGLSTKDQGRQNAQKPQAQGLDGELMSGDQVKAVTGLGKSQLEAVHEVPAAQLAHGVSVGCGDRGGSGFSYAAAVGSGQRSDVRLYFVPTAKLDEDEERVREACYDSTSPDWRPMLFRGCPSPRPPRSWRAPPSPGLRTLCQRRQSPMSFSSSDPDTLSSSEEGVASEEAVTAPAAEDTSDLEDGLPKSSLVPDLKPTLEDDGREGASSSSTSRSLVLSRSGFVRQPLLLVAMT
ncbi:hypothetical protein Dimus_022457 [Dionaea muscipula]